jgi:hypothetical protein
MTKRSPRLRAAPFPRLTLPALSAAALLAVGSAAWAAPPAVPEIDCEGPDCPAGEGYFGDAPAHMARLAEEDQGTSECPECEPEEPEYEEEPPKENPADDPDGTAIPDLPDLIQAAKDHCETYTIHWRVDCLGSELRAAAARLPATGDAGVIRAQVIGAADELGQIAAANANPAQPPIIRSTVVNGTRRTTARPIRSIAAARLPAANAAATAVLEEVSTTLLRSAPSDAARRVAFERAAQAVDSAKVLLRSA